MRTFELASSDFWGNKPERMVYELNDEVVDVFKKAVVDIIEKMSTSLRDGRNGRFLFVRSFVKGREFICKMEVSTQQTSVVFSFRAPRPRNQSNDAFYAYAICSVSDSFNGFASCVMGNDMGEYVCDVALEQDSAREVITHLQGESHRSWIENG